MGNNFKKCPELAAQNAQNQFQQSFNIVFLAQTASVPDVFEIIAQM